MKHIRELLQISAAVALFGAVFGIMAMVPNTAVAAPNQAIIAATPVDGLKQDACKGLRQVDSRQGCGTGSRSFYKVMKTVVDLISFIAGIIAVIMVMVAGVKYMTSGGDSQAVSSAKTTLIYALVGLAIVVLAQFLVRVVLGYVAR